MLRTLLSLLTLVVLTSTGCSKAASSKNGPAIQEESQRDTPHMPRIQLQQPIPGDPIATFEVVHLDDANLAKLQKDARKPEEWNSLFAVYVDHGKGVNRAKDLPVHGDYQVRDATLRFVPQFPLKPGVTYRAYFDPSRLPIKSETALVEDKFSIPIPEAVPGRVEAVYPSREFLPENQLKFYIHFSTPMSKGEAFKNIRLVQFEIKDSKRIEKVIEGPFSEHVGELWDPSGKRFTLLMDPGRIKRGLKPREELGPAFIEKKQYALTISVNWLDAAGNKLTEAVRKEFRILAPDDKMPDPKTWEIQAPPAATDLPLTVKFPEPMDHALLQRCLWVTDAKGRKRPGKVTTKFNEMHWEYEPEDPWEVGKYQLVVDTDLEDLAGNNLRRPFEVDVFKKVESKVKTETISIPFEVPIPGKEK